MRGAVTGIGPARGRSTSNAWANRINRELKRLKTQIAALEERKSKLMADFAR